MIIPNNLDSFKIIPGAFSVTECIALVNICDQAPAGVYLELGTHKGKSAYAAVYSLKPGLFHLVDPIFEDNELAYKVSYVTATLGSGDKILCPTHADISLNVIPKFNELSYVFVDSGSHQDGLPMQEAKLLEDRVIQGGIIAWHDFKNQFREPAEAAQYLVDTGKYEWIDINWQEIIDYVSQHNLEEGNDSWHVYDDRPFPNFVGAVKRK